MSLRFWNKGTIHVLFRVQINSTKIFFGKSTYNRSFFLPNYFLATICSAKNISANNFWVRTSSTFSVVRPFSYFRTSTILFRSLDLDLFTSTYLLQTPLSNVDFFDKNYRSKKRCKITGRSKVWPKNRGKVQVEVKFRSR